MRVQLKCDQRVKSMPLRLKIIHFVFLLAGLMEFQHLIKKDSAKMFLVLKK